MPTETRLRSSKYLNNLIEEDHRSIKQRIAVMLGFKPFRNAVITIAGIELMHCIRKGRFGLWRLRVQGGTAPEIRNAIGAVHPINLSPVTSLVSVAANRSAASSMKALTKGETCRLLGYTA
jgi:hypothetical protein